MCSWGGTVDFICKENIRKDRPFDKLKCARCLTKHTHTCDIGRQKVRCELDSMETPTQRYGKRTCHGGFSGSRNIFQKNMSTRKDTCQDKFHDTFLPHHDFCHILKNILGHILNITMFHDFCLHLLFLFDDIFHLRK